VEQAIHDFFYERGFLRVDTPISRRQSASAPGCSRRSTSRKGTHISRRPASCMARRGRGVRKIYTFGPTFRREVEDTPASHEFWMIEPEVAWNDSEANMKLQEELVEYLVQRVVERRRPELVELERDVSKLERIRAPFPRLNYTDAVVLVQRKGAARSG